MIAIYTDLRVDPARLEEFGKQFIELSRTARGEEGCLMYRWFPDPEQEGRCHVVSFWESEEALAAHRVHPAHVEHMNTLAERGVTSYTASYCQIASMDTKEVALTPGGVTSEGTAP